MRDSVVGPFETLSRLLRRRAGSVWLPFVTTSDGSRRGAEGGLDAGAEIVAFAGARAHGASIFAPVGIDRRRGAAAGLNRGGPRRAATSSTPPTRSAPSRSAPTLTRGRFDELMPKTLAAATVDRL